MIAMLNELAHDVETNANGHYPGADNGDVATLLRWLAEGHFTLLGYQRCPVRDGRVSGDLGEVADEVAAAKAAR